MAYRKSVSASTERYTAAVLLVDRKLNEGSSDDAIIESLSSDYQKKEIASIAEEIRQARALPDSHPLRTFLLGSIWYLLFYRLIDTGGVILDPSIELGFAMALLIAAMLLPCIMVYLLHKETRFAYGVTLAILLISANLFVGGLIDEIFLSDQTLLLRLIRSGTLVMYIASIVAAWKLDKIRPHSVRFIKQILSRQDDAVTV